MINDLLPRDFCEKWVPKIYQIKPGTRGKGKKSYRQACLELLSFVCDAPLTSVATWVDYPPTEKNRRPPRYLGKYLRLLDLQLENLKQFPSLYRKFLQDLDDYSQNLK